MLLDRSLHVLCADDRPPEVSRAALASIRSARLHVVGLDLFCPTPTLEHAREMLRATRDDPQIPPFRPMQSDVSPASRVFGIDPDQDPTDALFERIRRLGTHLADGVVIAGVTSRRASHLREALILAMTVRSRPGDVLLDSADLRPLPFVQLNTLDLPGGTRELLAARSFAELCAISHLPPVEELRGCLRRHKRGWTYQAHTRHRHLASSRLSDALGAALAAVVLRPDASVHEIFDAACAPEFGWSPAERGTADDPEKVDGRVRVWMRRIRYELAHWQARGLGGFLPQPGTRRVCIPVDIELDDALPWHTPE